MMNPSSTIFLLYFLYLLLRTTASPPPPPPSPPPSEPSCSDELVKFSVCLPYIASPPNNMTDTPPEQCCEDFSSSAFSSNHSVCLCYFIHQPLILGFPINSSRLFSIPSVCPNVDYSVRANVSLDALCSGGSSELPPLHSITGPERGEQIPPPEQQSEGAGPRDGNFAPEPSADSPTGSEEQSESPGIFDDYIVPEPAADSLPEPKSEKPTPSTSSTTMALKNRFRWVSLSLFFFTYTVMLRI